MHWKLVDEVLASRGIALPLEPKATVADHERLEKGRAIQHPIYGGRMRENLKDLPGSLPEDVSRLVTESFGDFYTREGLDIKTRELMIFCALATLGGTERQMASHAVGNLKVGNSKETMASAMVQALALCGFSTGPERVVRNQRGQGGRELELASAPTGSTPIAKPMPKWKR